MCNQELFTIFSPNSLKLFLMTIIFQLDTNVFHFTLAIEQNIISLAIIFFLMRTVHCTVEEIYEIRPVA